MHVEGGCYCGYVTYEAEVDPETVWVCHCTDCQQLGGSAFRIQVRSYAGAFKLLGSQPKIYMKTTSESGNKRAQAFCTECGTTLYATTVGGPDVYTIRVGTIRERSKLPPKRQAWCRSALNWVMDLESVPQHEKQIVR